MKKWIKPSVKIVVLDEEDIIVTSNCPPEDRSPKVHLYRTDDGGEIDFEN